MENINIEAFIRSYITCSLWSSTDFDGEPLDKTYDETFIADEALEKMRSDCQAFVEKTAALIEGKESDAGHDFWLTRNGHGAGFWDGDWGKDGNVLTQACKPFGTCSFFVGQDGKLHIFE